MKTNNLAKHLKESPVIFFDDNNPHPEFGKHVYVTPQGELYTGCTTISGAWKKDFLGPWWAKEAIGEAINRLHDLSKALHEAPNTKKAEEILMECKGAAKRKADEAKEAGKLAHDWCEKAINAKVAGEKKVPLKPKNKESVSAINAFVKWAKATKPVWLATEEVIGSSKYKIGGKIDALASIEGIPTLVDFKTSKQISEDYLIQLAGYHIMLSEMGFAPNQWLVLRMPKDNSDYETLTVSDPTLMEFYQQTFLHLREAHKFFVFAENKLKENRKMKIDEVVKKSIQQTKNAK